jgi:hypothetical protein
MVYGYGKPYFSSNSQAFGDEVPLHEITHTLGAVQDSAPHSSQAGHCYDEYDVECYDDGGSYFTSGGSLTTSCSDSAHEVYDCSLDDYFNPSPAPGSYLATHWNLFDSVFLCSAGTCGTASAGGGGGAPPPVDFSPPTTVVNPPPPNTGPGDQPRPVAFSAATLAHAVGLLRARARVSVAVRSRLATLRLGRAVCPQVCRGALSVYVLRGRGVRHSFILGRLAFSLRRGQALELRLPISSKVRGLVRRYRTLAASLALTANRATVTRSFTLRSG